MFMFMLLVYFDFLFLFLWFLLQIDYRLRNIWYIMQTRTYSDNIKMLFVYEDFGSGFHFFVRYYISIRIQINIFIHIIQQSSHRSRRGRCRCCCCCFRCIIILYRCYSTLKFNFIIYIIFNTILL